METLNKIKKISGEDADIGLNYGHYKPLAELINTHNLKVGVEIGCAYGNLAEHLLDNTGLKRLYSVDPYTFYTAMPGLENQEDYDCMYNYVVGKMYPKHSNRFSLRRTTSESALTGFKEEEIDFVFIDGDHSYEAVKKDIELYSTLLKPGAILSGHDITVFEGVDRSVKEYQQQTGKKLYTLPGNIWYFKM